MRANPFHGNLTQLQVDGINDILDTWEKYFRDNDIRWLAYALATAFHETAETMQPIEEYGEGSGRDYGQPVGIHQQCYFGRGFVQLTWESNYLKGEEILRDKYGVECPMHRYPAGCLSMSRRRSFCWTAPSRVGSREPSLATISTTPKTTPTTPAG